MFKSRTHYENSPLIYKSCQPKGQELISHVKDTDFVIGSRGKGNDTRLAKGLRLWSLISGHFPFHAKRYGPPYRNPKTTSFSGSRMTHA